MTYLGVPDGGTPTSDFSDDKYEEFRDVFSGEVLTAFQEETVFAPYHLVFTAKNGKSMSFPATWKAGARYHVPGTPILGSNRIPANKRIIYIDGNLIADAFIDDLEEAMNHYEVRSIHSTELGQALALEYDSRIAQVLIKAARSPGTIGGTNPSHGGSRVSHADAKTDASKLYDMIVDSNRILNEKNVSKKDRYCALEPLQYSALSQVEKVQNTRFGGHGKMIDTSVPYVSNTMILETNNMPNTNIPATIAGERNDYTGDFTNTAGIIWHKSAAGTVKLKGVETQMTAPDGDFNVTYQGHVMLAKYACGTGILRPESAIELATA